MTEIRIAPFLPAARVPKRRERVFFYAKNPRRRIRKNVLLSPADARQIGAAHKFLSFVHNNTDGKNVKGRISMDIIAMILLIIGGINWGSIGIFQFDIIAWAFGSQAEIISRIIYTLVGLSAIWCISLLFRDNDIVERHSTAESPHH